MTQYTFTNRNGETVQTTLSLAELAKRFANHANEQHWAWFWIAKLVKEHEEAPARADMIAFLQDSFLYAIGMGLKRPMIRLQHGDRRYKVYLSRRGTLCFKSGRVLPGTSDPDGDEEYVGCLYQGRFLPNRDRRILPQEQEVLDGLSADPVGFLARNSRDMNRCCYCNLPLEDKRSKEVGYGPVCAVRWGLPWGEKDYRENVPSFAQTWATADVDDRNNVRMLCEAVRREPFDAQLWAVLGDALEQAGFPPERKPGVPDRGVTMPSAS
jgi:hypothetical protein